MTTAADIQIIRNADPAAVLPSIDTMSNNPYATSTLFDATKITQNSKRSRSAATVTQAGAVLSSINLGTATGVKVLKALVVFSLMAGFAPLAQAHSVYSGCYVPPDNATGKLWYFDPVNGTSASGGADGSSAHPFRDLRYAFQTGQNSWLAGYPNRALLSTQSYDHRLQKAPHNVGVHGVYADDDWNPASPDPTRINPGDGIILRTGSYGDLNLAGYYGAPSSLQNVDHHGDTDSVFIQADTNAVPLFTTVHVGSSRGFVFHGLHIESIAGQGAAGALFSVGGTSQDIILENSNVGDWGTALPAGANGMPPWTQAQWIANMRDGIVFQGAIIKNPPNPAEPIGGVFCVAANSNQVRWTNHGINLGEVYDVEVQSNTVSHFSGDSADNYSSYNVVWQGNTFTDRFDAGNGDHPDFLQLAGSNVPGTYDNVVISHNYAKQLTDPTIGTVVDGVHTPPPGDVQGIDATNNAWRYLIVEDNVINTQACLVLNFGSALQSKIVNNTAVWSGGPKSSCYPWLTVGAAGVTGSNNLVENNVIAGSVWRHSCTNGDVWTNNRVYRIVATGAVQSITPSAVCVSNGYGTLTYAAFVGAGNYDGVVIDASTPMAYVFANYAPLSPLSPVNLTPTPYGPLYGTGAVTTDVPGQSGGLNGAWPLGSTKPNIGAL
jgi:hypothetical protein